MGDFAPDLKKVLHAAGCYRVRRGKGDHEIWFILGQLLDPAENTNGMSGQGRLA